MIVCYQIQNQNDHHLLQEDLHQLESWALKWGFNASKCNIISIKNSSSFFYQLDNTILQRIEDIVSTYRADYF